jgi:hypothetical protein
MEGWQTQGLGLRPGKGLVGLRLRRAGSPAAAVGWGQEVGEARLPIFGSFSHQSTVSL